MAERAASAVGDGELVELYRDRLVDRDSAPIFRRWLRRELCMARCEACGRWSVPPRYRCPECWSDRVRLEPVTGRGRVHLIVRRFDAAGVAGPPVVAVELEEQAGLRCAGALVPRSGGEGEVESVAIGSAVEVGWALDGSAPYPVFHPSGTTPIGSTAASAAAAADAAGDVVADAADAAGDVAADAAGGLS